MPKTVTECHRMYDQHPNLPEGKEFIELLYYPNSHAYKIDGHKKIGVSSIPDIIDKPGLRFYYMNEALSFIERKLIPDNNDKLVLPVSLDEWKDFVKGAKTAHRAKSDRGKDNGTRTHSWLEEYFTAYKNKTTLPALPERTKILEDAKTWEAIAQNEVSLEWNNLVSALEEFIGWVSQHEIEVVALEQIIYSLKHDYAGRFDAVLRIDGKLYLVDFKTNNPSREYPRGIFPEMFCQIGGYDIAYTEEFYPELDVKNQSCFDGHAVFNFNKQTGRFYKQFMTGDDVKVNRAWFLHALGTKKGQQYNTRKLSMLYKENQGVK
ncbi:MAG TPA: PD-(D/E)XK nuclease family protein [Candidatus Saccharimonadales bacterium]|nr:PD-(D/E)XK nuclease family protein [Candidatus Saccharimonadales bacterium]